MAETKILNSFIQIRNDSKENWESKNPVLLKGEFGVELGEKGKAHKIKIGDGITQWTALEYTYDFSAIMAAVDEKLADVGSKMQVYEAEVENGGDKVAALQAVAEAPTQGDIGIVKEDIAGGSEKQYTAYVYDGSEWKAMDGNYNAGNVYFDKDLVITAQLGVQKPDSSGSKTLPTKGKNVQQVFDLISAQEKNPKITQPSISVSVRGDLEYEVGTKVSPFVGVAFDGGSYEFGPATNVTATHYSLTDTNHQTIEEASGTFPEITISDGGVYSVTAYVDYSDGAIPKTNLGNEYTDGQIKAGHLEKKSDEIRGYRSFFYGANAEPVEINSANIRSLTNGKKYKSSFSMSFGDGIKQVIIALPNGHTLKKVEDTGAFGTDIVTSFVLQTAQVEGVDGYSAGEYNVYVYAPAAALGKNTYNITCA